MASQGNKEYTKGHFLSACISKGFSKASKLHTQTVRCEGFIKIRRNSHRAINKALVENNAGLVIVMTYFGDEL